MNRKFISILLIAILVVFGITYVLKSTNSSSETLKATFKFNENLAAIAGKTIPISFEIEDGLELKTVEILINDSLYKKWDNPSKGIKNLNLNLSKFKLGAHTLVLKSTHTNGENYSDIRLIRVLSDISPEIYDAKIIATFPHEPTSFTQGLEFDGNQLIEGTGLNDKSKIAKVELNSGKILSSIGLDATYFGEGITVFNDKIYQLTWQGQKCFIYDKNSLQLLKDVPYVGEGWGLCNDGKYIIMSNGTETLSFRDPETFQIVKTIEVYDQIGPRVLLNELEYINGKIYANIWMLDLIITIDPATGKVLEEINCEDVVSNGKGSGEVLNGIAYNKLTQKTYLTGKNWPKLLEVSFEKK